MGAASTQMLQPQQLCASGPLHCILDTTPWQHHGWDFTSGIYWKCGGTGEGSSRSPLQWLQLGDDRGHPFWLWCHRLDREGTVGVCIPCKVAGMLGELCWGPWKGEIFFLDTAFYAEHKSPEEWCYYSLYKIIPKTSQQKRTKLALLLMHRTPEEGRKVQEGTASIPTPASTKPRCRLPHPSRMSPCIHSGHTENAEMPCFSPRVFPSHWMKFLSRCKALWLAVGSALGRAVGPVLPSTCRNAHRSESAEGF